MRRLSIKTEHQLAGSAGSKESKEKPDQSDAQTRGRGGGTKMKKRRTKDRALSPTSGLKAL